MAATLHRDYQSRPGEHCGSTAMRNLIAYFIVAGDGVMFIHGMLDQHQQGGQSVSDLTELLLRSICITDRAGASRNDSASRGGDHDENR